MGWQSAGLTAEDREARKAQTIILATAILKPTGTETETQKAVEDQLGFYHGLLAELLCETKPGVEDWHFALLAGKGYDKGRGRLPDQIIFEFGLGQLVEFVQNESDLSDAEKAVAEQRELENIKALLRLRHKAHKLFTDGLDRIRRGYFPGKRNGHPKQWYKSSPEERLAAFNGWLDDIAALGCCAFEREAWNDWFRTANASSNMAQSAWHYFDQLEIDGGEICSLPCPPDWILGIDTEYFGAFDALDSAELLSSLILITESDVPYSVYHARFEQPSRQPRPFSVSDGELESEPDWQGDDIGAWISERQAHKRKPSVRQTL